MQKMCKFIVGRTSIVLSVLAVTTSSLCNYSSAQAQTSPDNLFHSTPLPSSWLIAQVNPMQVRWKLTYSVGGIVHESFLIMNGTTGRMTTRYYNPSTRRSEAVDQSMWLSSSSRGLLIRGYNPVYSGTSVRHPTYSPDNFLFQVTPNGSTHYVTCDDRGACSTVDVENF